MIGWLTGRFSSTFLAYGCVGLLVAFGLATAALGVTARLYVSAKAETAAEIEKCNTDKAKSVAEAEKIARNAAEAAAERRIGQLEAQLARSDAAAATERERASQAERRAAASDQELRDLAQEAFDEDDIPDSNACLNAYLTSRALRCVQHAGEAGGETSAGGGGGGSVCADPGGADGVHPGFSNVTYLDALQHWGRDRAGLIRWNERGQQIDTLQGEVVDDGLDED